VTLVGPMGPLLGIYVGPVKCSWGMLGVVAVLRGYIL